MADSSTPIRVFISYSHDSEAHVLKVRRLSDRLRSDGIDCRIDQYETAPAEGWRRWMDDHIAWADFVLVVCSEAYHRRARGEETPGRGQGATYEASLLLDLLYAAGMRNERTLPILLSGATVDNVPLPLRSYTRYDFGMPETIDPESDRDGFDSTLDDATYEALYRHLTDQPRVVAPALGDVRQLPTEAAAWQPEQASVQLPPTQASAAQIPRPQMPPALDGTAIVEEEPATTSSSPWLQPDLLRLLAWAVPGTLGYGLLMTWVPVVAKPTWLMLTSLALLATVAGLLRGALKGPSTRLNGRFVAFFVGYVLLLTLTADMDLLAGSRTPLAGFAGQRPANTLGLGWLEDWHYKVAAPAPEAGNLLLITFPSFAGKTRESVRRQLRFVIRQAREHGARGVALDVFLEKASAYDSLLVKEIGAAQEVGLPVIFGERQLPSEEGPPVRQTLAPLLNDAVSDARRGHLQGYLEADGKVRLVPMVLPGVGEQVALSEVVAGLLRQPESGPIVAPHNRLLRFVPPRGGMHSMPFDPSMDVSLLRDRFLILGSASTSDRVDTPFGPAQGVEIHAWSAHALATHSALLDLDPRLTLPLIYVLCFVLMAAYVRGATSRRLFVLASVLSGVVVVVAVFAVRLGRLWMELTYPLLAIWILAALLMAGRTWGASQPAGVSLPAGAPSSGDIHSRQRNQLDP